LSSGRGYKAISDLITYLENMNSNTLSAMREMQAEKQAIRKICEGGASNKEKIQTVLTMMD
ncbi:MAG: hypothetical protein IKF10_04920, partial [Lachnospiraceae bacterium]|nr:hypothetical protein [Lachnospiraceae bacterium]